MSQNSIDALGTAERRRLLSQLLKAEKSNQSAVTHCSLSEGQRAIWVYQELNKDSAALNLGEAILVEEGLEPQLVISALDKLIKRHPLLRSRVILEAGLPVQSILSSDSISVIPLELTHNGEEDQSKQLGRFIERPFDLQNEMPLRVGIGRCKTGETIICFALHHIVGEFWSLIIMVKDFFAFYNAVSGKRDISLPPLESNYSHFVDEQLIYLNSSKAEEDQHYWLDKLSNIPPTPRLSPIPKGRQTFSNRGLASFSTSPTLAEKVRIFSRKHQVSAYTTLLTAFALLLARRSDQTSLVIGAPMTGRSSNKYRAVIGYFDNPLPLKIDLTMSMSNVECVQHVRDLVIEALSHQALPIQRIIEALRSSQGQRASSLFDTMFVMRQAPSRKETSLTAFGMGDSKAKAVLGEITVHSIPIQRISSQYYLSLSMTEIDGQLIGSWEYDRMSFGEEAIEDLTQGYQRLLESLVDSTPSTIDNLPVLSSREEYWLTKEINPTSDALKAEELLHQDFLKQAETSPTGRAVVDRERILTYRELDQYANAIASWLLNHNVIPGENVAIVIDKSWQQIAAVLGVMKSGGAYLPIDPLLPHERQLLLASKGNARIVLSRRGIAHSFLDNSAFFVTSIDDLGSSEQPPKPIVVSPEQRAYTIFTSGSTGTPKGVMISHKSALNTIRDINFRLNVNDKDCILSLSPFSFDLSVYDIFGVLGAGGTLIVPEQDAIHSPFEWVTLCQKHGVTLWNTTPGVFKLALEEIERNTLRINCSSLRAVMLSGDWIPLELTLRAKKAFDSQRFISMGGATEASIWSIWYEVDNVQPNWSSIPYGKPLKNQRFYILDRNLRPVPFGVTGELFIGGAGVMLGYCGDKDLTEKALIKLPFDDELVYKTGDLGRYMSDGTVEFLGRKDSQVKIRGFRVELSEIEHTLSSHPDVIETTVLAEKSDEEQRLTAFYVSSEDISADSLSTYITERLPDYMRPRTFARVASIPLTENGKIDRKALLTKADKQKKKSRPSKKNKSAEEQLLLDIISTILRFEVYSTEDNLITLGADSIHIIRLASELRHRGFSIKAREIFHAPKILDLAALIKNPDRLLNSSNADRSKSLSNASSEESSTISSEGECFPLSDLPKETHLRLLENHPGLQAVWPLSPMQETMLLHAISEGDKALYCHHLYWRVEGRLDDKKLIAAFNRIVEACPNLRVAFEHQFSDRLLQVVCPFGSVEYKRLKTSTENWQHELNRVISADRAQGFDLSSPPLIRITRLELNDSLSIIILCHHHLLFDGWSVGLLMEALLQAYYNRPLVNLSAKGYEQFLYLLSKYSKLESADYWSNLLKGVGYRTAVPGALEQNRGSFIHNEWETQWQSSFTDQLKKGASSLTVTASSVIMAAWGIVLARYARTEDVVFGVTGAGRPPELLNADRMIGLFINTLPIRFHMRGDNTLGEVVKSLHHQYIDSREYEQISLPELAAAGGMDLAQFDPFSTVIIFENYPSEIASFPEFGIKFCPPLFTEQTNSPLSLYICPNEDDWTLRFTFNQRVIDTRTVVNLANQLTKVVGDIVRYPAARLGDISVASPEDIICYEQLNQTEVADFKGTTVLNILDKRLKESPQSIAVTDNKQSLTYQELNEKATHVAKRLCGIGIQAGDVVALSCSHRVDVIIAIYAVLKAGAAFLPMDEKSPVARQDHLTSCANAVMLIADNDKNVENAIPKFGIFSICKLLNSGNLVTSLPPVTPGMTAYIIFTSGTTGKPKGVIVGHEAIANYALSTKKLYNWSASDIVLQFCSLGFDASLEEIFGSLASGAQLVMREDDTVSSADRLIHFITEKHISAISLTTAYFKVFVAELVNRDISIPDCLRNLVIGGEKAPASLISTWHQLAHEKVRLFNSYGPTEATVVTCVNELTESENMNKYDYALIGSPVPNARVYILDSYGQIAPKGAIGELNIGGICLARGYVADGTLSTEKFRETGALPGETLYRTGDLARLATENSLEFIGRIDEQVKISGFRVEINEIETIFRERPGIKDCVICVSEKEQTKQLIAYLVINESAISTADNEDALTESSALSSTINYLRASLPEYMIPSRYGLVDFIPLTRSGKNDLRALRLNPTISIGDIISNRRQEKPIGETETFIAELWSELLTVNDISREDNFFELGGNSLIAVQMIGRVSQRFEVTLSIGNILTSLTVKSLAEAVLNELLSEYSGEDISRVSSNLNK